MSPRALASTLPRITKAILDKGGRDYATLIAEWPVIVGPQLAASSRPEKLMRRRQDDERSQAGVLTIRVSGGAALEIQHREPQIIERINAYLGYRGVVRLKLAQGVLTRRTQDPAPERPLSDPEAQAIDSAAARVTDPDLQERLARFGRALATRPAPPRR